MNMVQKKQNLCLNTSLNVKRLKIDCWLYSLPSIFNEDEHDDISLTSHIVNAVSENHEILDSNRNWSQLAFLEAHYIRIHDPIINHGLKASKELS